MGIIADSPSKQTLRSFQLYEIIVQLKMEVGKAQILTYAVSMCDTYGIEPPNQYLRL